MRVAIIDYQAGNLTSVQRALTHLGHASEITASSAVC
jgi:imidazoleglycerol phosphate synthase glutamine amidotransferase subunit HisH